MMVGSVITATSRTELAARFKLPNSNAANSSFVTSVKALIAVAEEQKELLVQEGMQARLLDDLNKMVSEFETTLEIGLAVRRDHIGARADLDVITAELLKQVKVLDGITRHRIGMNPEMMAEWKADKQVLGQSSKVSSRGASTPGGIAPAA